MTGLEALPLVNTLLGGLIKRAKDRETQALVQQIQTHQFVIQTDLMAAHAKIAKMDGEQAQAIAAMREEHRLATLKLNAKISEMEAQLAPNPAKTLEPITAKILQLFFQQAYWVQKFEVAERFRISQSLADYHLDKLTQAGFIRQTIGDDVNYEIRAEGRDYIVKNGLA